MSLVAGLKIVHSVKHHGRPGVNRRRGNRKSIDVPEAHFLFTPIPKAITIAVATAHEAHPIAGEERGYVNG